MDFDLAVGKLARNHSNHLRNNRNKYGLNQSSSSYLSNPSSTGRNRTSSHLSLRAKKEAEERKRKSEEQRKANQIQKQKLRKVYAYFASLERSLGTVKSMGNETNQGISGLMLRPVSIHGDGDKITLPVSVLTDIMSDLDNQGKNLSGASSPMEFRVGILNPEYRFPMSSSLREKMNLMNGLDDEDDDDIYNSDSDMDLDDPDPAPFLDELSCKYLAYTYSSVVEFTQEEGHVGLPQSIAHALIHNIRNNVIPTTRTVDPASAIVKTSDDGHHAEINDIDNTFPMETKDKDKTPGHLAWGEFDVPNLNVEVVLVKLPKGKGCRLVPTMEAVKNGFHQLKDIKAVLEQSLIRTRATLSLNDTVYCWHRGQKYDISVTSVTPRKFNAISCINTDIEVDIGAITDEKEESKSNDMISETNEHVISNNKKTTISPKGRTLGSSKTTTTTATINETTSISYNKATDFISPEPPSDQKINVCTIQIRGSDGKMNRRRFDIIQHTISELFVYANTINGGGVGTDTESRSISFRLVTRFPRRVFELQTDNWNKYLKDVGLEEGQEMLLIERL